LDEHTPVLVEEALLALRPRAQGLYVDATFGRGGHSARILQALGPQGRLLAIDRDPCAIAAGRERFANEPRLTLLQGRFGELAALVRGGLGADLCDGILFDLGVSSPQLDDPARGFSFSQDGPLDMRMDPLGGRPVSDWLATAGRDEIRDVIARLGEEPRAGRIASAIVRQRDQQPLRRTGDLAALVRRCVPGGRRDPATRTFQALRMHVNDELGELERGLDQALSVLAPAGRLAVISFHSLEDRAVKQFIRRHSEPDPVLKRLPLPEAALTAAWTQGAAGPMLRRVGTKLRPSPAEMTANPRARSAVLRVAERLP
jgi:16S rRNA (cytosine1402-N4)-methyltransferase